MLFVHFGHFVADSVDVVEAVLRFQVESRLEEEFAEDVQAAILTLVSLYLCEGVKGVLQLSVNSGVQVALIYFVHALLKMIASICLNELILVLNIALLPFLNDNPMHVSHLLEQTNVDSPLGQSSRLPDPFLSLLPVHLLAMLEHISLNQMKVLSLLLFNCDFLPALADFFPLHLLLLLLVTQQSIAQFVLFAQLMQKIAFSLLHLELEFTNVVLFELHFAPDFNQCTFRVFFQAGPVNVHLFLPVLALALEVRKFHLDVDRAPLDRVEAYVNVVDFENFGLLVVSAVHKKDVF